MMKRNFAIIAAQIILYTFLPNPFVSAQIASESETLAVQEHKNEPFKCPVTQPNGKRYTDEPSGGNHGNDALITGLYPDGKVVF